MVDLLQPVRRLFTRTYFLFAVAALVFCPLPAVAQTGSDPLAGRLGGSYGSFVAAYGEPVELNPSIGEIFQVEGYGLVAAQFSRLAGPTDEGAPALLITLRSERDPDLAATTPDDADWTIDEAAERIAEFAPEDAALTELGDSGDGSLSASCTSEALTASFGKLGEGGCSVRAVQSEPGRVSFITLSLASAPGGEAATPVAECAGVAEWAQASGERLTKAQELLGQLAAVDPATPTAGDDLAAMSAELSQLADEQRSADTPAAAATANFYLIGAFSGYATAIEAAATGLETGDDAAFDQATTGISDANTKVDRATAAITQLADECGLAVSPEATPVG
jgi:hypothetical protein